jgi:hypothetical protein
MRVQGSNTLITPDVATHHTATAHPALQQVCTHADEMLSSNRQPPYMPAQAATLNNYHHQHVPDNTSNTHTERCRQAHPCRRCSYSRTTAHAAASSSTLINAVPQCMRMRMQRSVGLARSLSDTCRLHCKPTSTAHTACQQCTSLTAKQSNDSQPVLHKLSQQLYSNRSC